MRRRKEQNGIEVFVDLIALLPWWAGLVSAILSYCVLSYVAHSAPTVVRSPDQMSTVLALGALKGMAYVGQFVVPMLCMGAAVISWISQRKGV